MATVAWQHESAACLIGRVQRVVQGGHAEDIVDIGRTQTETSTWCRWDVVVMAEAVVKVSTYPPGSHGDGEPRLLGSPSAGTSETGRKAQRHHLVCRDRDVSSNQAVPYEEVTMWLATKGSRKGTSSPRSVGTGRHVSQVSRFAVPIPNRPYLQVLLTTCHSTSYGAWQRWEGHRTGTTGLAKEAEIARVGCLGSSSALVLVTSVRPGAIRR